VTHARRAIVTANFPPTRSYYPDSDGEPMSDNTIQFRWIVTIQGNLDDLYRENPDVFVAGDHLIYPVEGEPNTRQAPDVYVAFGRPKGDRGSYKVWEEAGIFPQVVFEVWSPNNRFEKMQKKFGFYEKHGAEEYYIIYPEFPAHVDGWRCEAGRFVEIEPIDGWVSPRLGIRFSVRSDQIALYRPDGSPFLSFLEMAERATRATEQAAEEARLRVQEHQRAERFAAKLRELGIDPDAQ
jgi:Uma2 family endonuclease